MAIREARRLWPTVKPRYDARILPAARRTTRGGAEEVQYAEARKHPFVVDQSAGLDGCCDGEAVTAYREVGRAGEHFFVPGEWRGVQVRTELRQVGLTLSLARRTGTWASVLSRWDAS